MDDHILRKAIPVGGRANVKWGGGTTYGLWIDAMIKGWALA